MLQKNRVHFLYLHFVFQDEEKKFDLFIQYLQRSGHTFLSYSDAVSQVASGRIDKPYVCLSFDDGFDNCLQAGHIMNYYGISACFFLNTHRIDHVHHVSPTPLEGSRLAQLPLRYLSWADIEILQKLGHEIGGHTHSHVNMALEDQSVLDIEIQKNKAILETYVGKIHHFAWPFGRFQYFSPLARDRVFAAGYRSCASAERGAHVVPTRDERFCIRRENIVAAWPRSHIQYLLARSIAKSNEHTNEWTPVEEFQG
jgi:peptidoglycan/xylan/chitin deacetylase (PgdA/CDA1 family)